MVSVFRYGGMIVDISSVGLRSCGTAEVELRFSSPEWEG